jgi:hypothetical protein
MPRPPTSQSDEADRIRVNVLECVEALEQLHAALKDEQRHRPDAAKRVAQQLRRENVALQEQLTKLAALVDHHFAAWQESRPLLERRERELAAMRRNVRPQVIPIRP